MASLLNHLFFVLATIYILSSSAIKADDAGEAIANGYFPSSGYDNGDEDPRETEGGENDNPAQIVSKALLCFDDKYIYNSCEGRCRLSISGSLNVEPDETDEYCSGPCLKETHLVLSCIEGFLSHFVFYNKATVYDIRETIKEGCSDGPKRGDFNVLEHLQSEEGNAQKASFKLSYGLIMMIIIIMSFLLLQ